MTPPLLLLAVVVPVLGAAVWAVARRSRAPARHAVEQARRAIASARVDRAWRHLGVALSLDAAPSPEAATVNREVLAHVQRIVSPELADAVQRWLAPLDNAYARICAGGRGGAVLARATTVKTVIDARGEPSPEVLAAIEHPPSTTHDTIEVMPAALAV